MHDYVHIKYDLSPNFKKVILLISSHGSKNSTFTENSLDPKGYIPINQDNLKSKDKIINYPLQNVKKGI